VSKVGQTGTMLADALGRVNSVAGAIVGKADSEAVGVAENALVAEPLRVWDPFQIFGNAWNWNMRESHTALVEFPNSRSSHAAAIKRSWAPAPSIGHSL
jgi:hypothetical protein